MDTRDDRFTSTDTGSTPDLSARRDDLVAYDDLEPGDTVAALFAGPADAQHAVRELQDEGFPPDAIGVLMRGKDVSQELVTNPAAFIAEGAAIGAVEGGLLGGALGLLVGALVVPGVGPVVAGGALASALATAGPTALAGIGLGAATGGMVGALTGRGLPEGEEERLHKGLAGGAVAVTVHAGERAADAVAILLRNNGDTGAQQGNLNPLYRDQPAYVERGGHVEFTQSEEPARRGERALPVEGPVPVEGPLSVEGPVPVEGPIPAERADNLDVDVDVEQRRILG